MKVTTCTEHSRESSCSFAAHMRSKCSVNASGLSSYATVERVYLHKMGIGFVSTSNFAAITSWRAYDRHYRTGNGVES